MLTPLRPWSRRTCVPELIAELEHDLGVSRLVATLLALRGVEGAK